MKAKTLFVLILTAIAINCNAQSDYSTYLNKAREKIEAGDCEGAQKFYNVYKELSGQTSSSLEKSISDCNKQKNSQKTYSIGDDAKDFIGREGYKIAYLDASGKHGFAIKYDSYTEFPHGYALPEYGRLGPTIAELRMMNANRYNLGLSGEYWSETYAGGGNGFFNLSRNYTFDYSTGKTNERRTGSGKKYKRLKIIRF